MLGNICHIHITLFTFQFELLLKRTGLFNNTNMLSKKKKKHVRHYLSINGNLRQVFFVFCFFEEKKERKCKGGKHQA